MSQIALNHVCKSWNAARAVNDVSLSAESGELLALLGPSGCGKSTTLRLIAGLETADSGEIHIGARDVTHTPPAQRGISMVFQSYALFPHLTVAQNIEFGLSVRRVAAAERKRRLGEAAELLGLSPLLDRKPAALSGGQRQRIALGRAIVAQAPVCLMDEPLSNLDAQLRQQMRTEIRALQQRLGMTMVYVTHDQTEAMTMADRVVLMRQGRIEQIGTPAQLYDAPANAFVASFLGAPAMNLLPAAALSAAAANHAGQLIGVRPEHVRLQPGQSAAANDGATLAARVESVEYLGAESMVICSIGAAGPRITARSAGRSTVRQGDAVVLRWQRQHQHRFDSDHGGRIDTAA
ncbi:MAG: ABC transporter ATP-binding protein [Burkholderiaceae bacterium]